MTKITLELTNVSKEEAARLDGLHLSADLSQMLQAFLEAALSSTHADREGPPLASRARDSRN
jgi:hypothetical protein